jgi:hypothetical protein
VCTIGLTLGLKFKSEDRGVIYQTKGKDLIYTSMQSLGSHLLVEQDLTIRDRNPETRCYSSRVDKRRLNLVPLHQVGSHFDEELRLYPSSMLIASIWYSSISIIST